MIKYCLQKWDKNKDRLEAAIRADKTINDYKNGYSYLVKLVIDYILNEQETENEKSEEEKPEVWDSSKIVEIDHGYYQGTLLFLIPKKHTIPGEYEYLMTYADYGTCPACDVLEGIRWNDDGEEKLPTEQQVKDYMTLCRDLVSHMIVPYNFGWRHEERFDIVEEKVFQQK